MDHEFLPERKQTMSINRYIINRYILRTDMTICVLTKHNGLKNSS